MSALSVLSALFPDRVQKVGTCIEFTGGHSTAGYGSVRRKGTHDYAHRIAWRAFYAEIPVGQFVLHRCDNRACVNPRHLFLGTQKDNVRDMVRKGRHPKQKLTPSDRRRARRLYPKMLQREIGQLLGVSQAHVSKVLRGLTS